MKCLSKDYCSRSGTEQITCLFPGGGGHITTLAHFELLQQHIQAGNWAAVPHWLQ